MTETLASAPEEPSRPSSERPRRSIEDIAAERAAAQDEIDSRQREAVNLDARGGVIGEFLLDAYTDDPEAAAQLEPYIEANQFPDQAARILARYERNKQADRPDYDITAKPLRLICFILDDALEEATEEAEITQAAKTAAERSEEVETAETVVEIEETEEATLADQQQVEIEETQEAADEERKIEATVDTAVSYRAFLASIQALPNSEKLQRIAGHHEAPELQRSRAQSFLRIQSLAQTEADAAQIERRIEAQDFTGGVPEPGAFIRYEIFSSSVHDSGVSEATQTAIAEAFGMTRPPRADTGAEVRALSTEIITDPETGEAVPRYTEENPAEFRPGVGAWTKTGEEVYLTAAIPGHPTVTRDITGWSNDDICLLSEAMGFAAGLEQFGATGFVEDVYKIDFSLVGESAFDRESLRAIRQMISAMVGSFEGYDGDIFDVRNKIGLIRHQARLLNPDNTATGFENDRDATRTAARRLGFFDEDGQMNLDVLRAFGAYAQGTYLTAEADHADLHRQLHDQFPGLVEAPKAEAIMRRS